MWSACGGQGVRRSGGGSRTDNPGVQLSVFDSRTDILTAVDRAASHCSTQNASCFKVKARISPQIHRQALMLDLGKTFLIIVL